MSTTAKIIYILLAVFAVGLGIEGYFYYQTLRKLQPVSTSSNNTTEPKLIDITGQAIVGNLNLVDITKDQVAEWAKQDGIIETSIYSNSVSVKILSGYFKNTQGENMTILQGGKDASVFFNPGARLWIKDGSSLNVLSMEVDKLLLSKNLSQFIKSNDLLLIPNATNSLNGFKSSVIIIFR